MIKSKHILLVAFTCMSLISSCFGMKKIVQTFSKKTKFFTCYSKKNNTKKDPIFDRLISDVVSDFLPENAPQDKKKKLTFFATCMIKHWQSNLVKEAMQHVGFVFNIGKEGEKALYDMHKDLFLKQIKETFGDDRAYSMEETFRKYDEHFRSQFKKSLADRMTNHKIARSIGLYVGGYITFVIMMLIWWGDSLSSSEHVWWPG